MAPTNKKPATLPVRKLVLLLVATASLYQFVWYYRTADCLRRERDIKVKPWLWALVPLLGPLSAIPARNLAARLRDWQGSEGRTIAFLADPAMVAMLVIIAFLPLFNAVIELTGLMTGLVGSCLLLCVTYLALQDQLNRNLASQDDPANQPGAWHFDRIELVTLGLGCLFALPVYVSTISGMFGTAETLEANAIVHDEGRTYQMQILDEGWSRATESIFAGDADIEFNGPDPYTYAAVFDYLGFSIDEVLAFRQAEVTAQYSRAKCEQRKTLREDDWITIGTLQCSGRAPLEGEYLFASRVVRRDQKTVEIHATTSNSDPAQFSHLSQRVLRFLEGLELLP